MRYTRGKWTASYRDTFSLDTTLSPIIYAGLSRFHDVLEQKNREGKCIGIPSAYCSDCETGPTDIDVQNWLDDIKKMMYAFENKEPDMSLYDFKLTMVPVECNLAKSYEGKFGKSYTIECDNLEEKARYRADCDEHERLVQEGLDLFAKRWKSLWW